MTVDTSSTPDSSPREGASAALPLDPSKLTHAYRHTSTIIVPDPAAGRRSPLTTGHNMPPISNHAPPPSSTAYVAKASTSSEETGLFLTSSTKPVRRELQRVLRQESEVGLRRPPTPLRPSLPQLEPAPGAVRRGSRSRSETRAAPELPDPDHASEILDASIRSDGGGWRSVAVRPGRQGAAIFLPPIANSGKHTPVRRAPQKPEMTGILAASKLTYQSLDIGKVVSDSDSDVASPRL